MCIVIPPLEGHPKGNSETTHNKNTMPAKVRQCSTHHVSGPGLMGLMGHPPISSSPRHVTSVRRTPRIPSSSASALAQDAIPTA